MAGFGPSCHYQLAEVPFLALNPEDASRRRLEAALAQHNVQLRVAAHTPYAASVCELALRGLGVGLVNPITALDYAEQFDWGTLFSNALPRLGIAL